MDYLIIFVGTLIWVGLSAAAAYFFSWRRSRLSIEGAEQQAEHIVTQAKQQAEHIVTQAKQQAERIVTQAETEAKEKLFQAQDRRARSASRSPGRDQPQPVDQDNLAAIARFPPPSPFADVERKVEMLRRQVAQGILTDEECQAWMRDLMVEDADGSWWMVGYETGKWYRHNGTDWVQVDPPDEHR